MSDLRKASEALINHWEAGEFKNCTGDMAGHIKVLREALAQSEQRPADFYLSPPQREWVGLTDEEIQAERHKLDCTAGWTYDHFARAIEAKLKGKNTAPYTKNDITAGVLHKEWVGLTANEVYECWKFADVVASVEAKLKEKNT